MMTSATLSLGYVAVYVALVGVASFIEKPAGRGFGALQLNALIRAGSLAAAAVALVFAHGLVFPAASYLLAGLGIGLLTGTGSILYCFGLNYLPVSLVVTLSNLYIVITIVLGIVVLHEPITVLKIAGLTCTMAGVLVLGHSPARYAAHPEASSASTPLQSRGFAIMGIYVVMIGVGAFLEKPALKGLAATQLNALMGIAMTAVAGIALAVKGPRLPMTKRTLGGLGVGVMIGDRVGVLLPRPARAAGLRCLRDLECLRHRDRCAVGYLPAPTARPCPGRGDRPDTARGNPPGSLHRLTQVSPGSQRSAE